MSKIDLEERDVRVLMQVDEYVRTEVSTLREAIYWAERNQHIHYRLNKLEERSLVETWKNDDADKRGSLPPRCVTITDEGEALCEELEDEDGRPDGVEERLEAVEKQVGSMRGTYGEVKERIVELEETVEELEDEFDTDLESLNDDIANLRRSLDDDDDSFADGLIFGDE